MPSSSLKRSFLIIRLNLWAFLLDGLGVLLLVSGTGVAWLTEIWWWIFPFAILGFIPLKEGLRIHSTTPAKLKSFAVLLGKNRRELRPESFRIFLKAPCGRIIVREVLGELGKKQEYSQIKKQIGAPFCSFEDAKMDVVIIPGEKNHVL